MRTPDQFTKSLEEAETACIAYLAAVLGLKPGTNIFRSVNPGLADCGVFDIGYPFAGELNTQPRHRSNIMAVEFCAITGTL